MTSPFGSYTGGLFKEALRLSTPAKTDFCHYVWCEALMLARREITMPGRSAAWKGEEGCIEYPCGVYAALQGDIVCCCEGHKC